MPIHVPLRENQGKHHAFLSPRPNNLALGTWPIHDRRLHPPCKITAVEGRPDTARISRSESSPTSRPFRPVEQGGVDPQLPRELRSRKQHGLRLRISHRLFAQVCGDVASLHLFNSLGPQRRRRKSQELPRLLTVPMGGANLESYQCSGAVSIHGPPQDKALRVR